MLDELALDGKFEGTSWDAEACMLLLLKQRDQLVFVIFIVEDGGERTFNKDLSLRSKAPLTRWDC